MQKQFELEGKEVRAWVEQECVHVKAVDPHGDPVELTKEEAEMLADALLKLSKEIDS